MDFNLQFLTWLRFVWAFTFARWASSIWFNHSPTIIEGDESAADLSNNKQSLYDDGGKKRRGSVVIWVWISIARQCEIQLNVLEYFSGNIFQVNEAIHIQFSLSYRHLLIDPIFEFNSVINESFHGSWSDAWSSSCCRGGLSFTSSSIGCRQCCKNSNFFISLLLRIASTSSNVYVNIKTSKRERMHDQITQHTFI